MFWQDEQDDVQYKTPNHVVDISFSINCKSIPADHAWALSQAIAEILPWFSTEPSAGLHIIHGGASINGWTRPESADAVLLLSRRTKLRLRIPKHRIEEAGKLSGNELDIHGHKIDVGPFKTLLLGSTNTLLSRYIVSAVEEDEIMFTERMLQELQNMGLEFNKILSGSDHAMSGPDGPINTKSLLVSGLTASSAFELQVNGIGPNRNMGFGLFIASKSI